MSKSHFIKSYGCQMNAYDATRMADVLAEQGFVPAASEQDADLIILNTCHIREKATEKVFSELGRLRHADNTKPGRMVAVAGCVAQAEGEELLRRAPEIDMVFGPQTYHRLPEFLAEAKRRREDSGAKTGRQARGVLDTEFPAETKFGALPEPRRVQPAMFLTVQEGCDKFCTFCVVPYTRGAEYSRPAADVLHEAERLVAGGARELVLLGQNVNAWHGDGLSAGGSWNFAALLRELARRYPGVRLRYTTSHPLEMDDDLVRAHGELEALMPFLHLPVQSGSDRILAAMNRRHRADDYRAIVAKLRAARPDLGLSSDFITGFPGETDADFAATLALADEIGFAMAYSFRYSPRPGTPAAEMDAQVPEDVSAERLARLQALLTSQQHAFNTATIGRSCEVLFERQGRHAGQLVGRSPWNQAVAVADTDPALIGSIQRVRIEGLNNFSLRGRIDDAKAAAA